MSTKLVVGIIAAVVIIGGGAYFVTKNNDSQNNNTSNQSASNSTQPESDSSASKGHIFSLADSGKPQKCTFTYSGSNGTGTGTMYSDGTGRGLMQIEVQSEKGNKGKSNTLVLSDKVYGWMETSEKAIGFIYDKAKLTEQAKNSQNNPPQAGTTVDPNKSFDLNCESWSVDEAMLSVPKNINFMAMPTVAPSGN